MSTSETKHERAVRQRAEHLWRVDGCPQGRMDEYLERARELQAFIDNPASGQMPNPMTAHHGEIPPAQPVEEAALQENLGEFPGPRGGEDQGDRLQAPMTRNKARHPKEA
jgi:Protein of unknown function (DUF2934)